MKWKSILKSLDKETIFICRNFIAIYSEGESLYWIIPTMLFRNVTEGGQNRFPLQQQIISWFQFARNSTSKSSLRDVTSSHCVIDTNAIFQCCQRQQHYPICHMFLSTSFIICCHLWNNITYNMSCNSDYLAKLHLASGPNYTTRHKGSDIWIL